MYQPYEKTTPFSGETRKAMKSAAVRLRSAGFKVENQSEALVSAVVSNMENWNRCQEVLRNIVSIELRAGENQLTAHAELADYPVVQKFTSLLMGAVIMGAMYFFFNRTGHTLPDNLRHVVVTFIGVYFLVIILSAFTAVTWFKKGARNSVDALLRSMIAEAGGQTA
jgi:hypothetical protein